MGKGFWIAGLFSTHLPSSHSQSIFPWTHRVLAPVDLFVPGSLLCFLPTGKRRDFLFRGDNADWGSGVKELAFNSFQLVFSLGDIKRASPPLAVNYFQTPAFRVDTAASSPNEDRRW